MSAALADPLVEALSNAHVFGARAYTDGSTADVLPALACALVLFSVTVAVAAHRMVFDDSGIARWLRASARYLDETSVIRLLPAIFATQIVALFTMETLEQLLVVHHTFGALTWLGGPPAFSLALHAAMCVGVTFVLSRALYAAASGVARIVRTALRWLVLRRNLGVTPHLRDRRAQTFRLLEPRVKRQKGRAPPYPAV